MEERKRFYIPTTILEVKDWVVAAETELKRIEAGFKEMKDNILDNGRILDKRDNP